MFPSGAPLVWLTLYLLTFALHAVFVGYVVIGTGYALVQAVRRSDDAIAERVRDRLPFMLGCGITAGVAPLLFLQLLHQEKFYSANLVLGPRWGAVVPALIAGFYALYLAKANPRWRRLALGVGLGCFVFVAWSWTEIHLLMEDAPAWREMYAASERLYGNPAVVPRLLLWLGVMTTLFGSVAIWWARGVERKRLAAIALGGLAVCGIAVAIMCARGAQVEPAARGWLYLLVAASVIHAGGWVWLLRAPDGSGALLVAGAGTAALLAGAVVREAPRLALIEAPRPAAIEASGLPTFVATAVFGVIAITWVIQIMRTAKAA